MINISPRKYFNICTSVGNFYYRRNSALTSRKKYNFCAYCISCIYFELWFYKDRKIMMNHLFLSEVSKVKTADVMKMYPRINEHDKQKLERFTKRYLFEGICRMTHKKFIYFLPGCFIFLAYGTTKFWNHLSYSIMMIIWLF